MQTFLPYADLKRSAEVLHYQHLGTQINEVQILLGALHETNNGGYRNHPVTNAWRGHEAVLVEFGLVCLEEWWTRGYKGRESNQAALHEHMTYVMEGGTELTPPSWFGESWVHLQYKRLLVWKKPDFYGPKFPGVEPITRDDFVYPRQAA